MTASLLDLADQVVWGRASLLSNQPLPVFKVMQPGLIRLGRSATARKDKRIDCADFSSQLKSFDEDCLEVSGFLLERSLIFVLFRFSQEKPNY